VKSEEYNRVFVPSWLRKALLVFCLGFGIDAMPQVSDSAILSSTLEKFAEITEEDPDYQSIAEGFGGERIHQLPLASLTRKNLGRIPFLDTNQIRNILKYIEETGPILSVHELQSIPGLDTATTRKLLPCLVPGDPSQGLPLTFHNAARHGRHALVFTLSHGLEEKKGYRTDAYAGSAYKEVFRYSYTFSNRIKAAMSGEKDAGEQFFGPTQKYGMDYYAGYFALTNTGFIKDLIIGNFTASFGQGIVTGTGSRMGSVIGFNPPLRVSQGVRGSSSVYEGGYQRGVAASLKFKRIMVSGFFSRHERDASVSGIDTLDEMGQTVSSLSATGYHRTASEIARKNLLKETLAGGNISFYGNFFRAGLTLQYASWDLRIDPSLKPYNALSFRGKELTNTGGDFILRLRYISLFAEAGTSFNGSWAWIAGLLAEPAQGVTFSVTARDYDPSCLSVFSNAAGQGGQTSNERGCLLNVNARLFPDLMLAAYADIYRHPWLRYRVNSPSEGMEAGLLGTYTGCRSVVFTGRILFRKYEQNLTEPSVAVPSTGSFSTMGVRLQADWQPVATVTLKTMFELKSGLEGFPGKPSGWLAVQEVRTDLWKRKIQLAFRYGLFNVPGWDFRIYSYEPDLRGSFSVPAYDGSGIRVMLLLQGRITRHVEWWLKYGISWYEDKTTIGSGLEEIQGNVQSEIKVQVAVKM
jgi:hypothetical protein